MHTSILFINPSLNPHWSQCQPYGLLLLAGLAEREGHTVRIMDFNVEPLDFGIFADLLDEYQPDWVGIGAVTLQAIEAYRLGQFVKAMRPQTKLIYGGVHPTFVPDEAFETGVADFVALGESFDILLKLLAGSDPTRVPNVLFRDGNQNVRGYGDAQPYDLDDLPIPAFHMIDHDNYDMHLYIEDHWNAPAVDYMSSLGCPHACEFCASPQIYHRRVRFRSISKVIEDLEAITSPTLTNVHIHDDDFLLKPNRVLDFCDQVIHRKLGITWVCLASVRSILRGREVLTYMADAGCVGIEIGVESGDDQVISRIPKLSSIDDVRKANRLIRSVGIQPIYLMMAYNPGETIESPYLSARLIYALKNGKVYDQIPKASIQDHQIACHFLTLDPGQAMYDRRDSIDGLVLTKSWNQHVNERVNFIPDSFLDDVPTIDEKWTEGAVLALLSDYERTVEIWIPANFYVPVLVLSAFPDLEAFFDYIGLVYRSIDGKKSVRELFSEMAGNGPPIEILCTAISLLSILRLIRSRNHQMSGSTRALFEISWARVVEPKSIMLDTGHEQTFFCSRPWSGFEVNQEDGVVSMCCWAWKGYGNVNENSIDEIWNSSGIIEMRRKMATGAWRETCRPHCPYISGFMQDPIVSPIAPEFSTNLSLNLVEIKERKYFLRSKPRYWKVAHSSFCNLDCIMCYQDRSSRETLPESFYHELTTYYPYVEEVLLVGGEPLAISRIRRLITEFPQDLVPDAKLSFITNGTVFDARTIDLLRKVRVSWMLISVDAASSDTYSHIRRGGNLSRTIQGIKAWKRLGDEKEFPVVLSFTVMRDNVHEVVDFIHLAHGLGADCQFFRVEGTKANQHLIDTNCLASQVERALILLEEMQLVDTMAMARATLIALQDGP